MRITCGEITGEFNGGEYFGTSGNEFNGRRNVLDAKLVDIPHSELKNFIDRPQFFPSIDILYYISAV